MGHIDTQTAGRAFGLVIAAGASTAIGSAVVFSPRLIKLASRKSIAVSLAFASGVMLFVSLIDILPKASAGFEGDGHESGKAFTYSTLAFFAGALLMKIFDFGIERLLKRDHFKQQASIKANVQSKTDSNSSEVDQTRNQIPSNELEDHANGNQVLLKEIRNDEECGRENAEYEVTDGVQISMTAAHADSGEEERTSELNRDPRANECKECKCRQHTNKEVKEEDQVLETEAKRDLFVMGAATALAISLHNFPEGLITFSAYADDPAVGITLAVAIAIHNIPEGLCVSVPIFHATGSRWKAFWWGCLSGVSEPIGALIGWLVLGHSTSGRTFGILFGFVSGIMTYISIDELLPTAIKYDVSGNIVTPAVFAGMFLMAISLILFTA